MFTIERGTIAMKKNIPANASKRSSCPSETPAFSLPGLTRIPNPIVARIRTPTEVMIENPNLKLVIHFDLSKLPQNNTIENPADENVRTIT